MPSPNQPYATRPLADRIDLTRCQHAQPIGLLRCTNENLPYAASLKALRVSEGEAGTGHLVLIPNRGENVPPVRNGMETGHNQTPTRPVLLLWAANRDRTRLLLPLQIEHREVIQSIRAFNEDGFPASWENARHLLLPHGMHLQIKNLGRTGVLPSDDSLFVTHPGAILVTGLWGNCYAVIVPNGPHEKSKMIPEFTP